MATERISIDREYFGGYIVTVSHNGLDWHPYPWHFKVTRPDGRVHRFGGLPNQLDTEHAALMRGWYRAKWMANGTFSKRYV